MIETIVTKFNPWNMMSDNMYRNLMIQIINSAVLLTLTLEKKVEIKVVVSNATLKHNTFLSNIIKRQKPMLHVHFRVSRLVSLGLNWDKRRYWAIKRKQTKTNVACITRFSLYRYKVAEMLRY